MRWACNRTSKDWKFSFLPSFSITPKSWQKQKSWKTKNNSTKSSSQKNPHNKFLPKKSFQKIFPKNFLKKHPSNPLKNSPKNFQKIPKKLHKNLPKNQKKNPINFSKKDFENIQFPTSHLEPENPFRLVIQKIKAHYLCIGILKPKIFFLLPLFLVQLTRPTEQCAAFECSIKNWRKFGHTTSSTK